MKTATSLVLLVAILQVGLIESIDRSEEIIKKVNSLQTTWKAGINMYLGVPLTDSRPLLGTDLELDRYLIPVKKHAIEKDEIPERFDSREQWPECSSMNDIHNQGRCGVCWATATAGVLSDRECIHSKNHDLFRYSAENLATCGKQYEHSCQGGFPSKAILYWIQNGLVSGGRYKVHEGCQPFSDKLNAGEHIECRHECTNLEYPISYEKDLHDGSTVYALEERNPIQMQKEIMTNGPVVVSFTVYQDFNYYKSGVYQHVTGDYSGRHAVKLFGWGVENGVPYWILANSWGEQWGENGFFKILRGNDECGIESVVDAGLP